MRERNYVIGYEGNGQCAYGNGSFDSRKWVDLFTLKEAKKEAKKLVTQTGNKTIRGVVYKLVKVRGEK